MQLTAGLLQELSVLLCQDTPIRTWKTERYFPFPSQELKKYGERYLFLLTTVNNSW